ncbi:hypothetical protein [Bizionia arctica]|uniref:Uncharacterized protein n=1 Tax=Bizionia arctica TaxID=1495645 RepID=A0A917GUJ1_9FLAO|nr:hypothetical protein [Bizionia arctica]GGG57203.1 hypothetical protein GCM10010976_30060 [Bizionia arctica]
MKSLKLKLVFIIVIFLLPIRLFSQNQDNNIITIEEIYNHLISNNVSNIRYLVNPTINSDLLPTNKEQSVSVLNSTIIENVISDFKNEWVFIVFNNITIREINSDHIFVSGSISGKNIEKGMIDYMEFQHTWILENGVVIKFIE